MKRWAFRGALLLLAAALAAGGGAWWMYDRVQEPFRGYAEPERFVDIPSGAGPAAIGRRLIAAGVVSDEWTFRAALLMSGHARILKAGEYRFDAPLNTVSVIEKIARGDVHKRLLTIREGLTVAQTAALFEQREFGTSADFIAAAQNRALIADIDPAATDLEGYLFPETYALPRDTPATGVVAQMLGLFKKALTDDLRAAAAAEGLTIRQVMTLASLVEKETASADERPLVAAVYRNRLKRGMPMQADPTVIYALQKAGTYDGNLSRADLQFDSPYNTYRYPGLPPGPIASPGRASIVATIHPASVGYLYFVSKNDGTHVFSTTLAEHNRNVQTWQVQYFRKLRQGR